jgi:integrase
MSRIRLKFVNSFRDRHGRLRHYFRRPGQKDVPLTGIPGSPEFMECYQKALAAKSQQSVGASRSMPGTVAAIVAEYLDCSPGSTSPFHVLARETQRTRRYFLENFRAVHGSKRIFLVQSNGQKKMLLTREAIQRMVNAKASTPFGQRNFLNTLKALFKWAVSEGRIPENPTLGVTRQQAKTLGYRTWSENDIHQYKQRHPLGTMARLALELLLATAARRGDAVRLGPGNVYGDTISFEQQKKSGSEQAIVTIPLHNDFRAALAAMPTSNVFNLAPTFLTTARNKPFTAAGFGNWFRDRCGEADLGAGLSAHGLRKATARRLAELGCSAHQIAAITGHTTLTEIQRYTRAADRMRLAQEGMAKLDKSRS